MHVTSPLDFNKLFYHQDALRQWRETGDTSSPVHMQLSLSNGCNHRCPWCSIAQMQQHATPTLMDADRLVSFLAEMVPEGLKAATLVGNGEPLSHPEAASIMRRLHGLGLKLGVFTNASYLVGDVADAALECLTFIRMTMNGADPVTYNKTHGLSRQQANNWEMDRCVGNMKAVAERREDDFPTIGVQCATHQWNYQQLPEQAKLVRDYIGADYFSIKPVINRGPFQGRRPNEHRPRNAIPLDELEDIFNQCEALETDRFKVYCKREQFMEALPYDYNGGREYPACVALPFEAYIHENGNFDICGPIKLGGTLGGQNGEEGLSEFNIYRSSFRSIWHSETRQRLIANIDLNKCPAACRPHPLNLLLWDVKRNGLPEWAENPGEPDPNIHAEFL